MRKITPNVAKRLLSFLFIIVLVLNCIPVMADSEQISADGKFRYIVENGEATITGCTINLEKLEIPSQIDGYLVKKIGESAFYLRSDFREVIIPNTVTVIGRSAFIQCYKLIKVVIPDSVQTIEPCAFNLCSKLSEITWGDGLLTIETGAFGYCTSLTKIDFPNNLSFIGDGAFDLCLNLQEVTLPLTLQTLEEDVFSNCPNLSSITVDPNNLNYSSDEGVLFNKNKTALLHYPPGKTDFNYTVPDTVTTIGPGAFFECFNLKQLIILGNSVSIDSNAFGKQAITLYGISGSVTQQYANEHAIPFADIEKVTLGNPNGDNAINAKDALLVLKISVGKLVSFTQQQTAADANKDGDINAKDALEVLKYAVGKPSCLQTA